MKYYGIRSTSQIPKNAIHTDFAYEKKVNGKMVEYFHVWVKEDSIKNPFKDDEEPNRKKIKDMTKFFNDFSNQ